MPIWEAVLLGIVQGLTEFLPISSTAHLLVVRSILGHAHPEDAFTVVIQLGTLVAVFAYFRRDVARILRGISSGHREMGSSAPPRTADSGGSSRSAPCPPWRSGSSSRTG